MEFFNHLIHSIPLELFVFIGTIIDEIISPIPAFIVLVPAGITAHVQHLPFFYLGVLAIISGIARTLAGLLLYFIAFKLEGVLLSHGRKLLGISHSDIQKFGTKLSGQKPGKSWLALFLMHAMPVFPGTLLSVGSGFIKLDQRIFITATLAGSTVSALFFLYLGYAGLQTATILAHLDTTSQIISALFVIAVLVWYLYYRKKRTHKSQ